MILKLVRSLHYCMFFEWCMCDGTLSLAHPVINLSIPGKAIHSEPYKVTCRVILNRKIALQLIRYMVVEWVRVDGQSISEEDGVTIEQQQTYSDTATRSLIFDSLKMAHEGTYKCVANLILPHSAGSFTASAYHHINVLSKYLRSMHQGMNFKCEFLHCIILHRRLLCPAQVWPNVSLL